MADATATVRRPMLATLMFASALSPLAINIFIPSMASIAAEMEADSASVGLGLSLYLAATAAIQLVAGPLSDRFGRRPVIVGGMIVSLAGTLMCLFAESIALFLIGRVIQAASATGIALSRAIVRDIFARERAAAMIGYVTMGLAVAPMMGPAIGGMMDVAFGWRSVFWLLFGLNIVTLALLLLDLSETNPDLGAPMRRQIAVYDSLLRTPAFWKYAGAASLTSLVFFAFLGGAPFIAVETLGMSPAGYGLWFAFCAGGYMAGNFVTARLSERTGIKPMMLAGTIANVAAVVAIGLFAYFDLMSPATLFMPMFVVGFGNGLTLPTATAGGVSVRTDAAGAAAGLLGALQIGIGALGSVGASHLATGQHGATGMALLMLAGAVAGCACAASARRVHPSR